jgi:hypothetical protein
VAVVKIRTKKVIYMVKVSIEVRNGTARFMVGVKANNNKQALSIVQTRHPEKVGRPRSTD